MTDELKFFDPETGAELHRVPEGATIPKGTPRGRVFTDGSRDWLDRGFTFDFKQYDSIARFTREPIAPPLPTERGYYTDRRGRPWGLRGGRWYLFGVEHAYKASEVEYYAPFTPVTLVHTETWDRLRVLDPEDERDRVDADGDFMEFTTQTKADWGRELAARHWHYGPLSFADEVSGDA